MTSFLSYLMIALACGLGAVAAWVLHRVLVRRLAGAISSIILIGSRVGAAVMLLPCFFLAIVVGFPLGGGLSRELFGDSAAVAGVYFGLAASFFVGILIGATLGALSVAFLYWIRDEGNS